MLHLQRLRAYVIIRSVFCIVLQVRHELQQELEEALLGPIQRMSENHRPGYSGLRLSQDGGRDSQNGHHAPSSECQPKGQPIAPALVWQLNARPQSIDVAGMHKQSGTGSISSNEIEQNGVLHAGWARQPRVKLAAVAELVLPFTAGLLLSLLDAASKHPAVAAVALCSLALAQPCLINTGDQLGLWGFMLAQHGMSLVYRHAHLPCHFAVDRPPCCLKILSPQCCQ